MEDEHPTVKFVSAEPYDPYASVIERFVGMEFPQLGSGKTEDLMEAVMMEFLGTKQVRVGPKPNPESLVMMRDVVRRAVADARSIPILIPSAAIKLPIGEDLDVAELSALRMLCNLNARIQQHYQPGVDVRIRMEDLTELAISGDVPNIRTHTARYVDKFALLIDTLGYSKFIHPVPESQLVDDERFLAKVGDYAHDFEAYLTKPDVDQRLLEAIGWKGGISREMREFLYERYSKLYPGREAEYPQMAAYYFASILARRKLNAVGADPSFDGRLEISFANPLPDAPLTSTRVQYRTVPRSQSTLNMPYWNAKGYLSINEEGQPRIRLGNYNDPGYTPGTLVLSRNGTSTSIRADYILE